MTDSDVANRSWFGYRFGFGFYAGVSSRDLLALIQTSLTILGVPRSRCGQASMNILKVGASSSG